MRVSPLFAGERMPLVVQPGTGNRDICDLLHCGGLEFRGLLLEHGAVLFRGFDVSGVEDFARFVDATAFARCDYVYRSTPRTEVGDRIFTATEYPPAQEIPLHNENAYQRKWPLKLAFCCLVCASSGGATPLADMRRVTAGLDPSLLDRFESRGVRYVRHYRRHLDLPWEVVFQTEDPERVEMFCRANDIDSEWLDEQTLRTTQIAQGTARHPVTGERVLFNQAHLFHVSSLGSAAQSLVDLFGRDRLPRHACYGDAEEISLQDLDHVRAVFRQHAISFPWRAGDVLLLDNMQVAHGRRPFKGSRKVLAALLDPHSPDPLNPRKDL